jgi:PAS domain S-box-containing protein
MNLLMEWLSSNEFMPHGFCYQWKPGLVWLHAVSDTLVALAYFSIPIALIHLVRKRRDIPFSWMFVCFGIFIAACGATHIMEVWTLWIPSYWFSGGVKVLTAVASIPTAIALVQLMPQALSLPSPEEMRAANEELTRQDAILRKSEERFQQMAENIQEIFWMMNPETKEVTYVSPAFEQICELPINALYSNPTSYRDLIHPEDRQRVLASLEELERTDRFDEECRIVCPSGIVKWVRTSGFNARNSAGELLTFVGTTQEITARKKMEAALRESEDLFRDLVEHSSDLICTHNLEGRLLSVNELPAKLLGYSREEMLNKPMREFLLPEARAQFDESLVNIKRDGFAKGLMVVLTKSGERRIWGYHNTLRTHGVSTPIVRGIAHDVTDQKRMERALRLSEEKFSKAFLASPYAIVISTMEEGKLIDVNDSFIRIMGFSREESIGRTSFELGLWSCPSDRNGVLNEFRQTGRVRSKLIVFQTKCGKHLAVNYSAEFIEVGGRKCLLSVCEDITERKQAEEKLRQLSGQLLRLQDEERRRIARDLHDSTGQDLVALATTLSQLHASIPSSGRKLRNFVAQCQVLADQCVREVRTLSYLLHPPMLDEAGLEDAIRYYAAGFAERTGIEVELEMSPGFGRMTPDVEMALFRVVQESLTNVQRHSGSLHTKIQLDRSKDEIRLNIHDKGRGTPARDPQWNACTPFKLGVGIPSMQERVKLIGGRLEIESSGGGTTVRATIPVNA